MSNYKIPKLWIDLDLYKNRVFTAPKNYKHAEVLEYLGYTVIQVIFCPEDKMYITDENGEICAIIKLEKK